MHANFESQTTLMFQSLFPNSFQSQKNICIDSSRAHIQTQNILLVKNENERLGMHIKGGLNGQRGNPLDPADEGVFVSKINSSGAARRDGRLKVCIP